MPPQSRPVFGASRGRSRLWPSCSRGQQLAPRCQDGVRLERLRCRCKECRLWSGRQRWSSRNDGVKLQLQGGVIQCRDVARQRYVTGVCEPTSLLVGKGCGCLHCSCGLLLAGLPDLGFVDRWVSHTVRGGPLKTGSKRLTGRPGTLLLVEERR